MNKLKGTAELLTDNQNGHWTSLGTVPLEESGDTPDDVLMFFKNKGLLKERSVLNFNIRGKMKKVLTHSYLWTSLPQARHSEPMNHGYLTLEVRPIHAS